MNTERTLSIIKPDGVKNNLIGTIINIFEEQKLKIIAARMELLNSREVEGFYYIHRDKIFFKKLVKFMTSGPVFLMVLEGKNAVKKTRIISGHTDPNLAVSGSIREKFAKSIDENIIHSSDLIKTAIFEIDWFFSSCNIY